MRAAAFGILYLASVAGFTSCPRFPAQGYTSPHEVWKIARRANRVKTTPGTVEQVSCRSRSCLGMGGVSDRETGNPFRLQEGGTQVQSGTASLLRVLTGPQLSVAMGVGLLLAVLANRIATPVLVDSQARTDILGVIASGGLVTNGVYLLDLTVREAEAVTLVGTFVQDYDEELSSSARRDLRWLCESLLLVSPATSVLVYSGGKTRARLGVMGQSTDVREAPILRQCREEGHDGREQYLAALQTLPGKIEFDYLPENCQAVLLLPVMEASAIVIVGTNRARAFTPKDIAWMKGLCEKAALSLLGEGAA